MKTIRMFLVSVLIVAVCFALTACGAFNGYDDDEAIIKESGSSSYLSAEIPTLEKYTFTAKKFNGVKTVKTITVPESPEFHLDLSASAGKLKVVLIKDGVVTVIAEYVDGEAVEADCGTWMAGGTYILKVVGQDAEDVNFVFYYNYTA